MKSILALIYKKRNSDVFAVIFLLVFVVFLNILFLLLPVLNWLPCSHDAESWLQTLWQVHASILGVTVIVVTIIVTVIANEKDRNRTWKLYAQKAKFLVIVCFNLIAIVSEGLAPLITTAKLSNLIMSEGILFFYAILMTVWLFTITLNFLNDEYVENLAEKRIKEAVPDAVKQDLKRLQTLASHLQGGTGGH